MKPSLAVACLLLLCVASAHAVLRTRAIGDDVDTISLYPWQARDYFVSKAVGGDIQNLSLFLSLAAVPALYVPYYFARREGDEGSLFFDRANNAYLLAYVVLPAMSSLMAVGNLVYRRAAAYDSNREYALNRSLLPILVFSITATKLFIYLPDQRVDRFKGADMALITAYGFSELFTQFALRMQYRGAKSFLDHLQVKVAREGPGLDFTVAF